MPTLDELVRTPKKTKKPKKVKVSYDFNGRNNNLFNKHRKLFIFMLIVVVVVASVYLPSTFGRTTQSRLVAPAEVYDNVYSDFVLQIESDTNTDYDNDGIDNSLEIDKGSDPLFLDTDKDGICDYLELTKYKSNPNSYDNILENYFRESDGKEHLKVNSPYSKYDLIIWADDYKSKANGSIARTPVGYEFCNFTGWVKFSTNEDVYFYDGENYSKLDYRENEDAYYIDRDGIAIISNRPLEEYIKFTIFGIDFSVQSNSISRFFDSILPNGGFTWLKSKAITSFDIDEYFSDSVTNDSVILNKSELSNKQLMTGNTNSLSDLNAVYRSLEEGNIINAYIWNKDLGAIQVYIYGYDAFGNLLCSYQQEETLDKVNTIMRISVKSKWVMNKDEDLEITEYFDFKILDFDSALFNSYINFFGAVKPDGELSNDEIISSEEILPSGIGTSENINESTKTIEASTYANHTTTMAPTTAVTTTSKTTKKVTTTTKSTKSTKSTKKTSSKTAKNPMNTTTTTTVATTTTKPTTPVTSRAKKDGAVIFY